MDIASLSAGLANQQHNASISAANKAAEVVTPKSLATDEVVKVQSVEESQKIRESEDKRFQAVLSGAKSAASIFAVSDMKFTIFKDSSGQFITRFTSLRDGSVKYLPEPDIMTLMQPHAAKRESFYHAQV